MDDYAAAVLLKRRGMTDSGIVNQISSVKNNYDDIYNTCSINTEVI